MLVRSPVPHDISVTFASMGIWLGQCQQVPGRPTVPNSCSLVLTLILISSSLHHLTLIRSLLKLREKYWNFNLFFKKFQLESDLVPTYTKDEVRFGEGGRFWKKWGWMRSWEVWKWSKSDELISGQPCTTCSFFDDISESIWDTEFLEYALDLSHRALQK